MQSGLFVPVSGDRGSRGGVGGCGCSGSPRSCTRSMNPGAEDVCNSCRTVACKTSLTDK